jgi:glucan phosphorylase
MELTEEMKRILLKAVGTLTREEVRIAVTVPEKERVEFQLANGFETYKTKEGREEFTVVAKDLDDATEQANIWNTVIIGKVRKNKPHKV